MCVYMGMCTYVCIFVYVFYFTRTEDSFQYVKKLPRKSKEMSVVYWFKDRIVSVIDFLNPE